MKNVTVNIDNFNLEGFAENCESYSVEYVPTSDIIPWTSRKQYAENENTFEINYNDIGEDRDYLAELKEGKQLFFAFGICIDTPDCVECINGETYNIEECGIIDCERASVGYIVNYDNGQLTFKSAVECGNITVSLLRIQEDCTILNEVMEDFINNYINN